MAEKAHRISGPVNRSDGGYGLGSLFVGAIPRFCPFRIKPVHAESPAAESSRFDILRHRLDDDLVMLRKPTTNEKEDRR